MYTTNAPTTVSRLRRRQLFSRPFPTPSRTRSTMFRIFVFVHVALLASDCRELFESFNGEKCSVLYTIGYKYSNWYNVTATDAAAVNNDADDNGVLLKFYVRGSSNAHIMLTASPSSFGYEIVLGGGSNTFCDVRRSNRLASVVTVTASKVLDATSPVGFWIRVSQQSGMIEVGKHGEDLPFVFWTDPAPIPVRYFSFSSWDGVVSKWLFNCHADAPTAGTGTRSDSDNGGKFLTPMERLRRDVLQKKRGTFGHADTHTAHTVQQLLNVAITNDFKFIHLDVMTSTLTLRGVSTFEWTDNGIRWDPGQYRNISKLHLSNYELWRPELVLHNALDPAAGMFSEAKISVDNGGKVTWRPKFDVKTNCDIDLKSWPWDRHKCTVTLSTWSHTISNVFYEIQENNKPECFQTARSDWKLDNVSSSYVEDGTPWDNIAVSVGDGAQGPKQVSLQLVVEISRNTKMFEKLFYSPLILIGCLWLSSFCIMPNSTSKITTICVSIILSTLMMVYMTKYVPVFTERPPNLMLGYLKLMFLMSTDALVSSLLVTVHGRSKTTGDHPPFALTRLLTTPAVTRLLALPKLEHAAAAADDYGQLRDDDRPAADGSQRRTPSTVTLWDVVVAAFERVAFAAYFAVTVAVVVSASA